MKRDGRKLAHNVLEEMRMLAVQRMREGEKPADVSASFGMNRTLAYEIRTASSGRGKGLRALRSTKGTGRPRSLAATQERRVFLWVNGKNPLQYGFDFGMWTRQIVRELVAEHFEVNLSLASIGALLERLGLTPHKPLQRAYQRDPQAIERWVNETYPAMVRKARRDKAEIFFWDGVAPPRGQRPTASSRLASHPQRSHLGRVQLPFLARIFHQGRARAAVAGEPGWPRRPQARPGGLAEELRPQPAGQTLSRGCVAL